MNAVKSIAMEVVDMELGEPDESGKRSPRVKKGSEHASMPIQLSSQSERYRIRLYHPVRLS